MCGIAGVLRIHEPGAEPPPIEDSIPEHWLDVLDASIKHRGPDGQGRFRDRVTRPDGKTVDVALVHRRLSILDHARGNQPMVQGGDARLFGPTSPTASPPAGPQDYRTVSTHVCPKCRERGDGLVAVVFNGCIYNHRELRRELEAAGHVFESDHSDTEVILHGWRQWRLSLHERILTESMYGGCLWEGDRGLCFFLRDLFGQKPLYLCRLTTNTPETWLFSSTPTPIPTLRSSAAINPAPLASWITYGFHYPGTIPIAGAGELERNACTTYPLNDSRGDATTYPHAAATQATYFPKARRPRFTLSSGGLAEHCIETLEPLIRQCVASKLEADVPIACLLSGGVDSSLVAKYAKDAAGSLTTVSVRMNVPGYDESPHAEQAARAIGTEQITLDVSPKVASDLTRLIHTLGLPFGDSSLLPTYWACRAASEVAPVVLTGDGADELFLGYDRYFAGGWADVWFVWGPLAWLTPQQLVPQRDPRSKWTRVARFLSSQRRCSYESLLAIFQEPDARKLLAHNAPSFPWLSFEDRPGDAALYELDWTLPGDYLRKVDTASMAVPVESRAPFLDKRLLDATNELRDISRDLRTLGGRKGLLKRIARKHLPASIVNRPKQGFAIPIGDWFRTDYGHMRQLLHDHLRSTDPFPNLPIDINMRFVEQMLDEHDAAGEKSINPWHGRDHSQRLYMLLVLSIWAKWLDGLGGSANGDRPSANAG